MIRCRLASATTELARRRVATGGALVGSALHDDHSPCPAPDEYAWDLEDGTGTARLATAPRDESETCGYRVTEETRWLRYLTVAARGMGRYDRSA